MTTLARSLRVLRWTVGAVMLGAILLSAFITLLGFSGRVRLRAELTGSMAPSIHVGDLVAYLAKPARDVRPGDTISFNRAGTPYPITHRVLQQRLVDGHVEMTTKGDANPSVDQEPAIFDPNEPVWNVYQVIPGAGQLTSQLTGLRGVIFVGSFLPLFFVLPWLERRIQSERELDRDAWESDRLDYDQLAILGSR